MDTLVNSLREILGTTTQWWHSFESNNNYNSYSWDYGYMLEYMIAGIILCVIICNVFKTLRCLIK